MARFSLWEYISKKNDFDAPSNMKTGEIWTLVYGFYDLLVFILILSLSAIIDEPMIRALPFVFLFVLILLYSQPMYIRMVILPHKNEKQYAAGCTTLLITAWISMICAGLHACYIQWEGFELVFDVCFLVNAIIAFVYSLRLDKQAKKEGRPSTKLPWFIHMGWFLIPIAALLWFKL